MQHTFSRLVHLPPAPVEAVLTSLSIWYFNFWSIGRIFSSTFPTQSLNKVLNFVQYIQETPKKKLQITKFVNILFNIVWMNHWWLALLFYNNNIKPSDSNPFFIVRSHDESALKRYTSDRRWIQMRFKDSKHIGEQKRQETGTVKMINVQF